MADKPLTRIPLAAFEIVPPEILANPFVKSNPVVVAEMFEFKKRLPDDENETPTPSEA